MARRQTLVRLTGTHVVQAVIVSAVTMVLFFISDLVRHELSTRDVIFLPVAFVGMTAVLAWGNWHDENKLEGQLREARRPHRVHARPKTR